MRLALCDTFWKFIQTLNRAQKRFNSIFIQNLNLKYSFNKIFIQTKNLIIHSTKYSFKKIHDYSFNKIFIKKKCRIAQGYIKGVGLKVPIFLQKRHIWAKTNRQELIGRRRREGGREASSSSPCWPPPPSGRCSPLNETSACQLVLIHTLIDTWLMVGYWWEQMCSITPLESYQSSSENYSKKYLTSGKIINDRDARRSYSN